MNGVLHMRKKISVSVMKRAAMLMMLVLACVLLTACYIDPDRVVDNQNGLNAGDTPEDWQNVITSAPPATPTPSPTPDNNQVDWSDWDFGADLATNIPVQVQPTTGTVTVTQPTGVPSLTVTTPGTSTANTPRPTTNTSSAGATPTPAATAIKLGASGNDVKRLQNQLKTLGYYTGSVDGDFGAGTEAAVKAFQQRNGLTADGKAGRYTLEKLYSGSAVKAPASTPTPRPNSSSGSSGSTASNPSNAYTNGETDIYLRLGSSGKQVKTMQNRLIVLGYLTGEADGDFDAATEDAVKAFQDRNNIYDDGVAGPETLTRLYSSSARKASSPAAHLGSLSQGAQGSAVRSLQRDLKTLGYYNGSIDGDYGSGTFEAVKAFQRANGLTVDGKAGKATLNKISALLTGGSTSSSGTSGSKEDPKVYGQTASSNGYSSLSASNGSSAKVSELQASLKAHGYYSGSTDGSYGSGTEEAVKKYQKAAGLRVTGIAGPSTQRMLYGSTHETGSYSKLEMGSSGSAVKRLQYALYELKYYDGDIDGRYETATYNAVLMFQEVNGLYVDGVAGQDTQRRLFSSNAVPNNL